MFLYELAIALDKRSPELIEAATQLGMGDLQPASDLSPQQVAALRDHFGGGFVPPPLAPLGMPAAPPVPPPMAGPPPSEPMLFGGPVPPPPPLVGEPPRPDAPSAPPSWGPPAPPSTWGPPPGAVPQTAPASGGPAHAGPHFAYPDSPTAPVAGAPAPPYGGFAPPSVPPMAPPPSSGGLSTGQKALIGGVVLVVVALFGFMAVNTGPDEQREREIASKEAAIEAELDATTSVPATTSTTAAPTTTTAAPAQDQYAPVDVARFCAGGIGISTFELRLVAAMADNDFDELAGLVRDRRAAWNDDIATMASGAAPILVNDIELYRGGYDELFDAVESSSSFDEVWTKIDRMSLAKSGNAGQEFAHQIAYECQ